MAPGIKKSEKISDFRNIIDSLGNKNKAGLSLWLGLIKPWKKHPSVKNKVQNNRDKIRPLKITSFYIVDIFLILISTNV